MSSKELCVHLPFPPSVNNLFSQNRGRRFPSAEYRRWRKEADLLIMAARLGSTKLCVSMVLELCSPDGRKRDVDNYTKAPLDALVRCHVIEDDAQVTNVQAKWVIDRAPGVLIKMRTDPAARRPLTKAERALFDRKFLHMTTVRPGAQRSRTLLALIEKGWVRELPGPIDGCPQGYVATNRDAASV